MINMLHNLKYTILTIFRSKMLIFWTFAFPIILGTFFNMAFSNIENSEKLEIIDIAIVENENFINNNAFKETFNVLSDEKSEERLFNTKYVTKEKAKELLENEEITGYIILEDEPKVIVRTSGIDETILKYVTEEIVQTESIMKNIIESKVNQGIQNPEAFYSNLYNEIAEIMEQNTANIENVSNNNLSYTMIEFYTLIAMTCLYGGILGVTAINNNLANMSSKGKRVSMTPTSKIKVVISTVMGSYFVQLIGLALLFVFTIFVLKVDYGNNLLLIILLSLAGSFAGLSLGVAIGTVLKTNEDMKVGIIISVTMLGCFLSGMMGITMKYMIDKNIPIINKINPVAMITDGFYALYYYDTLDRYYFNIASLCIFSILMMLVSYFSLRRQKYDSI